MKLFRTEISYDCVVIEGVEASNELNDSNVIKVLSVITFGPKCKKGVKCNNF